MKIVIICSMTLSLSYATQAFTIDTLRSYVDEKNLYLTQAMSQNRIAQKELEYDQGFFDTQLSVEYDDKDYPTTKGNFYQAGIIKPTRSGIDFSLGFRESEGLQEYNNIKTAKGGEFIFGAKIPLVAFLNNIDKRRLKMNLSQKDLLKSSFYYKEVRRKFYFKLMSTYYTLLYSKAVESLHEEIVQMMEQRVAYLDIKVNKGNIAPVQLIEAKQQALHLKQDLITARQSSRLYFLEFLQHLNIDENQFTNQYHLPEFPKATQLPLDFDEALHKAMLRRPDLKMLSIEKEKLLLKNQGNELAKYPHFQLNINGVYDEQEQSGVKLSLQMNFPIARTQYKAQKVALQERMNVVDKQKELQLLELRTDLQRVFDALRYLTQNIENSKEEITLLKELQDLERRRFELGSSTLFLLNQREMRTVQARIKLLGYKLKYHLLHQTYERVTNVQSAL